MQRVLDALFAPILFRHCQIRFRYVEKLVKKVDKGGQLLGGEVFYWGIPDPGIRGDLLDFFKTIFD